MRMKTQRILAAWLSLVLLLALAPTGWAEGGDTGGANETVVEGSGNGGDVSLPAAGVVLTDNNTVTVNLVPSDKSEDYKSEIVKAHVQADLYLIANAVADPMYDTYSYNFDGSAFANLKDRVNEALKTDPAVPTTSEIMLKRFSRIAQAAAEIAKDNGVSATATTPAAATESTISVTGLPAGMYLLVLHGSDLSKDTTERGYLTTAKKAGGGQYGEYGDAENPGQDVTITVTRAFSDYHEFLFEPQLITVPTKVAYDSEGKPVQQYNTAYGEWTNTLNIVAKPDWKPRNGILKITKTLTNYADLSKDGTYVEPMTFSFSVVGTDPNGNTVYQKEVALSVTSPVNEAEVVTLKDIPIGTTVTVTETYSGAHATGSTAAQTVVIQTPTETTNEDGTTSTVTAGVSFTNTNTNTRRGGHGIENKFTFDKEAGQWDWTAIGGDGAGSGNEGDAQ